MPLDQSEQQELREMHQQIQAWAERLEDLKDREWEKVEKTRSKKNSRPDFSLPNMLGTISDQLIDAQKDIDETLNDYADR